MRETERSSASHRGTWCGRAAGLCQQAILFDAALAFVDKQHCAGALVLIADERVPAAAWAGGQRRTTGGSWAAVYPLTNSRSGAFTHRCLVSPPRTS
jgi:hypothetical protein